MKEAQNRKQNLTCHINDMVLLKDLCMGGSDKNITEPLVRPL